MGNLSMGDLMNEWKTFMYVSVKMCIYVNWCVHLRSVPDPHRGTKGTCLGPRASGGPAGPSGGALRYWKKKEKGKKEKLEEEKKWKFEQRVRGKWKRVVGLEKGREGRKLEGGDWHRGEGAPHLACALGPATWGSGPVLQQSNIINWSGLGHMRWIRTRQERFLDINLKRRKVTT